jgi:hypothetical protein
LIPRETSFHDLLEGQADRVVRASVLLIGRGEGPAGDPQEAVDRMIEALNQTFITPFDPEDLYRLSVALADVEAAIVEASRRAVEVAVAPMHAGGNKLAEAVGMLRDLGRRGEALRETLREVARVTAEGVLALNDSDAAARRALEACRDAGRVLTVIVVKGT